MRLVRLIKEKGPKVLEGGLNYKNKIYNYKKIKNKFGHGGAQDPCR